MSCTAYRLCTKLISTVWYIAAVIMIVVVCLVSLYHDEVRIAYRTFPLS